MFYLGCIRKELVNYQKKKRKFVRIRLIFIVYIVFFKKRRMPCLQAKNCPQTKWN